jgi:hypothetical protein
LRAIRTAAIVRARVTPVRGSIHLRGLYQLINGCVEGLILEGDYATCLVCEGEMTEIQCAFAVRAEAADFARSMEADVADSGWTSTWARRLPWRDGSRTIKRTFNPRLDRD